MSEKKKRVSSYLAVNLERGNIWIQFWLDSAERRQARDNIINWETVENNKTSERKTILLTGSHFWITKGNERQCHWEPAENQITRGNKTKGHRLATLRKEKWPNEHKTLPKARMREKKKNVKGKERQFTRYQLRTQTEATESRKMEDSQTHQNDMEKKDIYL